MRGVTCRYPASCLARQRREQAFALLYEVAGRAFGQTRAQVDGVHRRLEDYVFGELVAVTFRGRRLGVVKERTIMQKHHKKKLDLARTTIRILGSMDAIAGGISGTRGRNTVENVCVPGGGSDGATCNDSSQDNCGTGVVSHCLCTTHATKE